jgi:hypothetical protein
LASASESDALRGAMSDTPRIRYSPRPDATLGTELNALTTVYKFVLSKSNASQKAVESAPEPDGHDDAMEWKHGCSTAWRI